jgi:hypothetical protein
MKEQTFSQKNGCWAKHPPQKKTTISTSSNDFAHLGFVGIETYEYLL